jgi:hypothetical protein
MRPFVDVESEYLAPLMNTWFRLDGTTVRKLIVGPGMVVQKLNQYEACPIGPRDVSEAEAAGGPRASAVISRKYQQPKVLAAYLIIDGWSRKMGSKKFAGARFADPLP